MPKVIKFSESSLSKTRSKGNMRIGANSHDYGTSYYSMIDPPAGGYTVYENKASGGPSIRVANNETELINITRESSGTTYASAAECLAWFATQTDKLVVSSNDVFSNIVTDGLILDLNAANLASYPTTGTAWYDLSGNGNNASKSKGTWNSNGYWDSEFDSSYYGGRDRLRFSIGHSTSLSNAFSTTTGGWAIEELIRIDDNTYPEAAAGSVISDNAYSSGQVGFDWNHGVYNTQIKMGVGNNLGEGSGYDVSIAWNLPAKYQTLGRWYRRSFYWNRATNYMGVYYNGELIGNASISAVSGKTLYDGGGIVLGELYGWCHDGARAEVKAYSKVLSQSEVLQNYYGGDIVTDNLVFATDPGNLVSYDKVGSTMYSLTGSHAGTINNATYSSYPYQGYFNYDGADDYIEFPDSDDFTFSDAVATWEAWCRPTGNAGVLEHTIMTKANYSLNTREYQFQVRYSSGTYYFYLGQQNNNAGWKPIGSTSTSAITINNWYHILVTSDGNGNAQMYINGILRDTATGWWTTQANLGAPLCIGATINSTSPIQEFVGDISICRLYKKHFSASDVQQNFNAQRNRFGI